jgi:hypothetical protein
VKARSSRAWSGVAASTTVAGLVALAALRLTEVSTWHLSAPFDLALERPGANTILLLQQGVPIYSPATYDAPPFNLTIYTPAYHYLVAVLPAGESPFTTGRVVSTAFMLLAAATLFLAASGMAGRIAALGAAGFFLCLPAVTSYVMVARQDPMALFLSALAVGLVARSTARPIVLAAALAAVLAILTKQSYVAAAATCVAYLLWRDRKAGWTFLATLLAGGCVAAAGAQWAWGSGFWWSVVVGPSQRFDWNQYSLWGILLAQRSYAALTLVLLGVGLPGALAVRRGGRPSSPFSLYLPASVAVLLLTMGKQGSWLNYFLEPTLAGLGYLVTRLDRLGPASLRGGRLGVACLLGFALFVADFVTVPVSQYAFSTPERNAARGAFFRSLDTELSRLPGRTERLLFSPALFANPSLSLGRPLFLNDSYLYTLLWADAKLTIEPLLAAIRRRHFDVVLLPPDEDLDRPRFAFPGGTPAFYRAVAERYRLAATGSYQYWVPRESP